MSKSRSLLLVPNKNKYLHTMDESIFFLYCVIHNQYTNICSNRNTPVKSIARRTTYFLKQAKYNNYIIGKYAQSFVKKHYWNAVLSSIVLAILYTYTPLTTLPFIINFLFRIAQNLSNGLRWGQFSGLSFSV